MNRFKILLTALSLLAFTAVYAQMELPQPSPSATVSQTAGLTDITIEYNSPGAKGRTIFGGLVPYGQIWRMGANSSTKITFSEDVTIGGKSLKAGTYSLGAIPNQNSWTLIFSNTQELGGWGNYNQANDALRVQVTPKKLSEPVERMRFTITDFDNESATINMEWADLRVPFEVELGTMEQAEQNITNTFNPSWNTYASAARYYLDDAKDYDRALEMINNSIDQQSTWFNNWIKATVLEARGDYKAAHASAQTAWDLGLAAEKQGQNFFYKSRVEQALKDWKAKM